MIIMIIILIYIYIYIYICRYISPWNPLGFWPARRASSSSRRRTPRTTTGWTNKLNKLFNLGWFCN